MSKERLLMDAPLAWSLLQAREVKGVTRAYYAAPAPYRLLLVCHGMGLPEILGRVVDASIGEDAAYPGFARVVGEVQTKISVYAVVEGEATDRLSRVLKNCHKD